MFQKICLAAVVVCASLCIAPESNADEGPWKLHLATFGNSDWVAMKIHTITGETWRVEAGEWRLCNENGGAVPEGQYSLSVIASPTGENWWAVRINTITGDTWQLSGGDLDPMYDYQEPPYQEQP